VRAFLAASRSGDLEGLISLLDPSVVLRADAAAVAIGATAEVHGAAAVAETFSGRARAARPALVDDAFALVWAQDGTPRVVFALTFGDGVIAGIDLIADPDRLARFSIEFITTKADEQ
jgi:RNA polymerase sigma-70 factor (ECF subfamily)